MKRMALGLVVLVPLLETAAAHGQVVVVHVPFEYGWFQSFQSQGFGLQYRRRNLAVSAHFASGSFGYGGVVGLGPYGPVPPMPAYYVVTPPVTGVVGVRANIHYQAPPPLALPAWRSETEGIDLDLVPPRKPKEERPLPAEPGPAKEKEPPGVDVSRPKAAIRPPADEPKPPPPPKQNPPPEPAPPDAKPKDLVARLIDMGLEAFAAREYGTSAKRFRQATFIDRKQPLAYFLLAQAEFALGKYDTASAAIEAGMKLHKTWPNTRFHPRAELYAPHEEEFVAHLKGLEEAIAARADGGLLFLYAYQLWFDGRRLEAIPLFRQARQMVADSTTIDRFLAATPGVAAK
jgi:hypothetical protein